MNIAVIGSGISGLSAAWLLQQQHNVVLYESGNYAGGHTNSVEIELEGIRHPVDTGFLVHNTLTYPHLVQLFAHLGVSTIDSDMSFSVAAPEENMEWAGTDLSTVFAQKRNLIRPAFLGMLKDILHFNKHAQAFLTEVQNHPISLGQLLDQQAYSDSFRDWYLLPMAAAIWSTPTERMLDFPAETFLRFCINHRLLQIHDRPVWRSIPGGCHRYVQAMTENMNLRLNTAVTGVDRDDQGVTIHHAQGTDRYDAAVFATHAPDSLALLNQPTHDEQALLGAFSYQDNLAILHTDRAYLPERESLWSAWNYRAHTSPTQRSVCVSYWLNRLQALPFKTPVLVTLNPPEDDMPKQEIQRFEYAHPVFDQAALAAQKQLHVIQGQHKTWFCGAWTGYGFHEDGLKSALRVARMFGISPPWEGKQ